MICRWPCILLFIVTALLAHPALAQNADTLLVNGKVITLEAAGTQEALAIRDGKVLAVGSTAEIRRLAGPATATIDLEGRTVIPGLIDSHMHAVRAALFYATEVNWIGTTSIAEAMTRISAAAKAAKPGQWIIVAGGWTPQQFAEKRRPTQAELLAAAPEHPVYIQLFYAAALLSPSAMTALNINSDSDVPPAGKIARDEAGRPTGWIEGNNPTITALFDKLPLPSFEQKVAGTRAFFRELNRLGLTGVGDPGGYNLPPTEFSALFKVWQDKALTVRVSYSLFAQRPNVELEDFQALTQMLPMGFGDDMLRFNGIGENVTWGVYNNDNPSAAQKDNFIRVATWAARQGLGLTIHWHNNKAVPVLLDLIERVNRDVPINGLRWSIAHLNDATPETMIRLKALGMGWTMQSMMYFGGEAFLKNRGAEVVRLTPPIVTALKLGLNIGAGTDAHRVMTYNPFAALQWMLDGKTVAGMSTRSPRELPSREQALRLYSLGSAWFSRDDDRRGSLAPGKLADLAVLNRDYMTVPVEEIGRIESLLTMVGGQIVYTAAPYQALERRPGN